MNIYLIERKGITGYDEHDAFVVAADKAPEARLLAADHAHSLAHTPPLFVPTVEKLRLQWLEAAQASVEKVGTYTGPRKTAHVILDSFNAG
ncbi:hypothetical protein E3_0290 [Rhodococcus phage E3]|uniref:hypothetical protein n=1 Tax=Rhodococcus phage E3 TaxID=1007869 RepID=UPI0002C6ABCE|nr:hypothetical protein M176_gp030 [Rhodococcus phage E3]AEQ20940.1 hypothetical protein E3_0290 [Rhodococcus phage E3]